MMLLRMPEFFLLSKWHGKPVFSRMIACDTAVIGPDFSA